MSDKDEATRLADALGRAFTVYGVFEPSPREKVALEAADLLRRWPDGEPVGKVLTEAEMGIGWDGRAGNILWWRKPDAPALLYTAPPAKPDGEPVAQIHGITFHLTEHGQRNFPAHGTKLYAAPPDQSARIAERKWLDNECLDGGCQSLKWRERIAALEAEKQANYEHWRNAEIDLERHRAALKVAREALEGWRSVDVHSALTEDEADAIKAKDDAALRAIEGVQHG